MEKVKIENAAKRFLDAWIANKSYDINKRVVTNNVEIGARRQLFKDVLLRRYDIISCSKLSDVSAVLKVQMSMNLRGQMRNKRLQLYAVKVKNDWKIDITSFIRH
jgi:hypothetical protein